VDGVNRGIMIAEVVNADGKPVAVTNNIVKNYNSYGILMHWPNLLVQDNTVDAGSSGDSIGIVI
jgi:hypothetical protein